MKIRTEGGLPWVEARLVVEGYELVLERMLIDTGSAATLVGVDPLLAVGVEFSPEDPVFRMRGVGGVELVVARHIDRLEVGRLRVGPFRVQVGAMDYGFPIDGLIGTDFLTATGAVIDFPKLEIGPSR